MGAVDDRRREPAVKHTALVIVSTAHQNELIHLPTPIDSCRWGFLLARSGS